MTSLLAPLAFDRRAPLARRNPVAKLAAVTVLSLALLLSGDPVTPAVVVAVTVLAWPLSGLSAATLARRGWPFGIALFSLAVANAQFTADKAGEAVISAGPVLITTGSAATGLTAALRMLAIALPGVLAVATTDPVDLADALVQQLRLPARFAYGALAALRLLPLLATDWHTIGRARRARGIAAGRNPFAAVRLLASQSFGLLVSAIRRGIRLSVAMDARGFNSGVQRTFAREQRMHGRDWALLGSAFVVAAVAVGLSVTLGTWRLLLT